MILPTIQLGILSGWRFEEVHMDKILKTVHLVVYLLVINVPMLVIRIMLWSLRSQDISVFIIKNVLSLGMTLKAIIEHFIELTDDSMGEDIEMNAKTTQTAAQTEERV